MHLAASNAALGRTDIVLARDDKRDYLSSRERRGCIKGLILSCRIEGWLQEEERRQCPVYAVHPQIVALPVVKLCDALVELFDKLGMLVLCKGW